MASPSIIGVCSDELQCIVCYDLYKYPITLPCGHSFCCACLEKYWESRKQDTACVCPNCRKVFPQKPKVKKNVILAGMVERMKLTMKAVQSGVDVQQDVHVEHHCEVCFRMAAKRCVPCDILCCEIHMKPHQHKGHKVVNPQVKLEELVCANHGKPIQLYCKDDETMMCLMCQMCKDGKHKNHDVVTLESVHAELKDVLKTKCPEVSKSKQHLQSQLHQLQEEVEQTQHTGQSTEGRLEEKRRELYQLVDETVDLLMSQVIKRKNKKLSLLMKNMEKRQQQLKSVQEAESLLQTALQELEAIYFMQGFKDLVQRLESVSHFQYLKVAPHTVLDFFKEENNLNMLVELNRNLLKKIHKPVEPELSELEQSSLRSLYGRTPNLDPNSASPWILVSHDLKMATRTATDHPEPNHPDRFDVWEQVLSADSFFSGRHYWEVDVSLSRSWRIGVALNSMGRKGAGRNRLLGRNPESWCLQKYKKEYTALHNDQWTCLSLPGDAERFGFCLDCEAGELRCFVDSQVLHVFRGNFLDPVKPAIGVYQYDDDAVLFCSL